MEQSLDIPPQIPLLPNLINGAFGRFNPFVLEESPHRFLKSVASQFLAMDNGHTDLVVRIFLEDTSLPNSDTPFTNFSY